MCPIVSSQKLEGHKSNATATRAAANSERAIKQSLIGVWNLFPDIDKNEKFDRLRSFISNAYRKRHRFVTNDVSRLLTDECERKLVCHCCGLPFKGGWYLVCKPCREDDVARRRTIARARREATRLFG